MTRDSVNEYAHKKFLELRSKLKLDVQKAPIQKALTLTQDKIDEMSDIHEAQDTFTEHCKTAVTNAQEVDNTFEFINSLDLPSRLSLAIGLIISYSKTGSNKDLAEAIKNIELEMH